MLTVPLSAVPSQTTGVVLNNQNCQIDVYTKTGQLYMDVYVNNAPIILGVLCLNANRIVRSKYLGFSGDFIFIDTQGKNDPIYTGLGDRYILQYMEPADLSLLGFDA